MPPKKRRNTLKAELFDAYCDIINIMEKNYGTEDERSAYKNAKKRADELEKEGHI